MEIRPAREAITVFLAGDSTVTDQRHEPYAGSFDLSNPDFPDQVDISASPANSATETSAGN